MLLMAGRDAHPTVVNITPYLKTLDLGRPLHRADTWVRPYNNGYTDGVMVLCRAGHTGWHRTTHCRTTTFLASPIGHDTPPAHDGRRMRRAVRFIFQDPVFPCCMIPQINLGRKRTLPGETTEKAVTTSLWCLATTEDSK